MAPKTVEEIYSKTYASVHENDMLSKCLELLEKEKSPVLAVLDKEGKYKGVLAERWVRRSGLDLSTAKVQVLMRSAPTLEPRDPISKAAKMMIESNIRQLPVFKGEKLLGFVSDEQVIHSAVMDEWGNSDVQYIMTRKPYFVDEDDSVASILTLFRDHDISHALVMNKGRLVGMVSVADFIEHIFKPLERPRKSGVSAERSKTLGGSAKEIMSSPVITVSPQATLKDAEQLMHKNNVHSLVVVVDDYPIGIVTKRDFLEPLAQREMAEKTVNVQFAAKEVQLDDFQREYLVRDFKTFSERYQPLLESGTLFVYIKTHGKTHKGDQLIHVKLQLRAKNGNFYSASDSYNLDEAFHLALEHLERQFIKTKEFELDREHMKKYFQRIQFPESEL
ncbi:MAG: CBS domain-containing protein [Promethearchaeati archaeon SRVP18_Atabeyarchaeia-1]